MSLSTIANIYDLLYERSVAGNYPDVQLLSGIEVKEVEKAGNGYRLVYRHLQQNQPYTHETDCIILATGYHDRIPDCIANISHLIQWDEKKRYIVNIGYNLALTPGIPNQIFVQSGEFHTHGLGSSDLGLGAYRNSVIINTLVGRTLYPVQQRNVFQQFGIIA